MNKLVVLLMISTLVTSVVSGLLFFQLSVVETENNELNDELFDVSNRLKGEQMHSLGLEEQVSELQNQTEQLEEEILELETQLSKYTNLVKITKVTIESGFNPLIALTLVNEANVKIENFGVNDVEGLVLIIKHSSPSEGEPNILEVLHVGEKREINCNLFSVVGTSGWVTVTLKLDEAIIDEYVIPEWSPIVP